jgi:hypothetical protein
LNEETFKKNDLEERDGNRHTLRTMFHVEREYNFKLIV